MTSAPINANHREFNMAVSYPVTTVANTFLQRDFEDGVPTISPMKLQKLVYCLHGWYLAVTGNALIPEKFSVWQYGPVQDELYHRFKRYRDQPIREYATTWHEGEQRAYVVPDSDKNFQSIFDAVSRKYMPFSALELSSMTHQQGTPWSITLENGGGPIDDQLIKKHFIGIVRN